MTINEKKVGKKSKFIMAISIAAVVIVAVVIVSVIFFNNYNNPVNMYLREVKRGNDLEAKSIYEREIKNTYRQNELFELLDEEEQEQFLNEIFINDLGYFNNIINTYNVLTKNYLNTSNWYDGNPMINKEAQDALNSLDNRTKLHLSIERHEIMNSDQSDLIEIRNEFIDRLGPLIRKIKYSYYPTSSSNRNKDIEMSKEHIQEMKKNIRDFYSIYDIYIK